MFNTAMMKRNSASKFRSTIQKSLVPDLTHSSCINKDECCSAAIDDWYNFIDQLNSQMPCPGKFFYLIRKNRFDLYFLLHFRFNDHSLQTKRSQQNLSCLAKIPDRR